MPHTGITHSNHQEHSLQTKHLPLMSLLLLAAAGVAQELVVLTAVVVAVLVDY
jgi:hypothetical protein